jgi:hypothetical protein
MWVAGPAAADVLAVSVDGRWRCAGPRPHIVDVVEKTESTLPWPFAMAAAFSFDRHRVALATRMEIGIFDVATHDVIATLGRHTDEEGDTYTSVALNQDGTLVATGSRGGGRAHVWDVASGRPIRQIDGTFVTLSADGRFVASSTIDGGLIVHAIDGGALRLSGEHALRHLFDRANSAVLAVTAFKAVEYSLPVGSVAAEYPRDPELIGFSADGRHVLGSGNRLLKWPDRSPEAVIARARKAVYRTLTDEERDRFGLRRPPRALE